MRRFGLAVVLSLWAPIALAQAVPFRLEETTITDIHAAMLAGKLSCRSLVDGYLRRIEAYDKRGPAINALVVLNPAARTIADSLDRRWRTERRLVGPLHCIPMVVKDNFETVELRLRRVPSRSKDLSPLGTRSRSSGSARRERSCWPNPTWPSSPSVPSRR